MSKTNTQPIDDAPAPDDPRWQSADSVDHAGKYWAMWGGYKIPEMRFEIKEPFSIPTLVDVFLLGTELRVALDGASPTPANYADKWLAIDDDAPIPQAVDFV